MGFKSYLAGIITAGVLYGGYKAVRPSVERSIKENSKLVNATVLEESRVNNDYALKLQTDDGKIMALTLKRTNCDSDDGVEPAALDLLIEKGTRISFPQGRNYTDYGFFLKYCDHESSFDENARTATRIPSRIKILEEKK